MLLWSLIACVLATCLLVMAGMVAALVAVNPLNALLMFWLVLLFGLIMTEAKTPPTDDRNRWHEADEWDDRRPWWY